MKEEWLDLEKIRTDGGTQPRACIDEAVVDEYVEALENKAKFPPILVFYDGTNYWLVDGFHRYHAHVKGDYENINVEIRQGTQRQAVLESVGVNASHGLRRTNEDKRRAVLTLLNDEEWGKWTGSEIARRCKVHQTTVSAIKREFIPKESLGMGCNSPKYLHPKSGKVTTMNTTNLGRKKEQGEGDEMDVPAVPLKEQLKAVNKAIESGEISNKELESTRKALLNRSVDKQQQEDFKSQIPKKSKARQLNDRMDGIVDELTLLADGNLELEEGDRVWIKAIVMKGPNLIWQFHKLGVDLRKVYRTLIDPKKELDDDCERKERERRLEEENVIDIEPEL